MITNQNSKEPNQNCGASSENSGKSNMNSKTSANRLTLKAQVNLNNLFFSFEKVTFRTTAEELTFWEQKRSDAEHLQDIMESFP